MFVSFSSEGQVSVGGDQLAEVLHAPHVVDLPVRQQPQLLPQPSNLPTQPPLQLLRLVALCNLRLFKGLILPVTRLL